MLYGFQAAGAAPLVARRTRSSNPETVASRDPDRQPGPLGGGDDRHHRARAAASPPSPTSRSSTPTAGSPRSEGVFCEPASRRLGRRPARPRPAAARAAEPETVVCVLTGHGLKDPDTALEQAGSVVPCDADLAAVERADLRLMQPPPPRPRPRLLGQPRARASTRSPRRSRCTWSSRSIETPATFAVETDLPIAADRRNLAVRGFERLHPADGFTFRITLARSRSAAGSGTSAAALRRRARRRRPPVRARRRPAAHRHRARGPPRQRRRRRCSAASSSAPTARRVRARPARRARGRARRAPTRPVRTEGRARGAARRGPARRRRLQRRARRAAGARARARRLRPRRRAACATASTRTAARTSTRARWSSCDARRASSARSARRSPAPARPCSSGRRYEQTGAVVEGLRELADGWAPVMRVPFESAGADVRSL